MITPSAFGANKQYISGIEVPNNLCDDKDSKIMDIIIRLCSIINHYENFFNGNGQVHPLPFLHIHMYLFCRYNNLCSDEYDYTIAFNNWKENTDTTWYNEWFARWKQNNNRDTDGFIFNLFNYNKMHGAFNFFVRTDNNEKNQIINKYFVQDERYTDRSKLQNFFKFCIHHIVRKLHLDGWSVDLILNEKMLPELLYLLASKEYLLFQDSNSFKIEDSNDNSFGRNNELLISSILSYVTDFLITLNKYQWSNVEKGENWKLQDWDDEIIDLFTYNMNEEIFKEYNGYIYIYQRLSFIKY